MSEVIPSKIGEYLLYHIDIEDENTEEREERGNDDARKLQEKYEPMLPHLCKYHFIALKLDFFSEHMIVYILLAKVRNSTAPPSR